VVKVKQHITDSFIVRGFSIKPREHFVEMKEKAVFGVEGVVMLFGLHCGRTEVGREDVKMDVPENSHYNWGEIKGPTTMVES
jgi:hypothetical protein